jgi:hypothetical protein
MELGTLYHVKCDCGCEMIAQEKELLSGAVKSCGCDGEPYYYTTITNEKGESYQLVSAEPMCPECRRKN